LNKKVHISFFHYQIVSRIPHVLINELFIIQHSIRKNVLMLPFSLLLIQ